MALQEQITQEMTLKNDLVAQENKLAKEKEKKQKELEKKEKQQKKMELSQNIIQGISNVALAVTKALAKGPIIGAVLAALAAAAGAIQVGVLTAQFNKLESGGLLRGKRHSQGGMRIEGSNIEVEGGEYVVNRISTQKNLGLIRYINSQRKELQADDLNTYFTQSVPVVETPFHNLFASGGQLPVSTTPSNAENEQLMDAIRSIKFSPKVAVTDIMRVQDEMTSVDGWAGL